MAIYYGPSIRFVTIVTKEDRSFVQGMARVREEPKTRDYIGAVGGETYVQGYSYCLESSDVPTETQLLDSS